MTSQAKLSGCVLALLLCVSTPAHAHDQYDTWRSHTGGSCCSNADCRPTRARYVDDHWEAWNGGYWMVVPAITILPFKAQDGRSHLCEANGTIYCFTPGDARY